jgi:two-component system sensor histidine kinase CreC
MIFIIAMIFGAGVSVLVSRSATKLIRYTTDLSKGKMVEPPKIRQVEFSELAEAIKKLRIEVEEKEYVEEMISTMAHELRTPITGIRMNAENLQEITDKEKRERSIQNILDANNRMDLLINRILDLSRLELRDKLEKTEKINIKDLVDNVLKQFNRRANISKQKVHIREDIDADINIQGDRILLEQALGNVIDNAVSFSPENANLDIELQSSNKRILLKIRDEGPGIPGYAEGKVFSRFYSTVKPDSGRRSNGLGLRFVKKIMELHKGEVTLKNRIMKKGAEAIMVFPIEKNKK